MKRFVGSTLRPLSLLAFVLAASSLVLSPAHAQQQQQQQQQQGPPVVRGIDLQFVGPQTISRERILSQLRTKVGQPYSDTLVEQDIRTLYSLGALQNVRIFGQPDGDGVKVIVVVQTRAVIREIEIDGAHSIHAARLRKDIKLKVNQPVNEDELEKARQSISDSYQAKGFTDVTVQFRVDTDDAKATARVVYTIDEGEKGAVNAIQFEGNTKFSGRVLRKQMKTKSKTFYSFLDKSGRLEETQLKQDLDSLREWYQNHGYVDVEIKDVRKQRRGGHMTIVVVLNEGSLYRVGKLSATGEKAAQGNKILALLKFKEGDVYSPKAVRDGAKAIADGYGAGGYVDVDIVPQTSPGAPGRIDLSFKIQEGNRSFVQRINIVGNIRTKDKVIRREVLITPGDVYNTVRVDITKKRLDNLGYFAKVETFPEDTGVEGRKDLLIQVEEKRTGSLNFGAGYSTVDNLVGFVELTQGNFDILNWPTFTGGGQKFRTRIQFGSSRKDFVMTLTEPYFLDRRLSLGGEIFYHEADFLSSVYDQRDYGFSIDLRKAVTSFLSVGLTYRLEQTEAFDISSSATPELRSELGEITLSQVLTNIIFDTRDNPFLTHKGQRITFTPYIAGGFLGGNTQIYGGDLEGSQYFKLPWDTILLFNGEVAVVDTWGDGSRVPIYNRLFLGGSSNLRGFEFRDVGPRDKSGEPLGGLSLARATVEYTFPIIEKVRGAVFYDTGVVNEDSYDFSLDNIASDYGVGLRMDLPVGPIRIDYGFPLQRAGLKTGSGGKINFSVGYQF